MAKLVFKKMTAIAATAALMIPLAAETGYAGKKPEETSSYKIENPGFEAGTTYKGWVQTYGTEGFAVDGTKASEGRKSLKLDDRNSAKSAGLSSSETEVTPGQHYRFDADVQVTKGTLSLIMIYQDKNGQEITRYTANVPAGNEGGWKAVNVSGKAPANAVHAELLIYSGVAAMTEANVDNVRFSWEEQLELAAGEPVDLGEAVKASLNSSAAIGQTVNGKSEIYLAVNGVPATFYAIDAHTGKKLFSQPLPGADTVWATHVGKDGNVYFAGTNDGILYRYLPAEKRIENLGQNPSDKWIWDLEMSEDGKVYGATYPNAKVFEYDTVTGAFKDLGNFKQGQMYARGIGISGDYLYVGIGTDAYVTRMNLKTGIKEDVPIPIAGQNTFIANIEGYGGKLFIRAGGSTIYVLNEATLEHINTIKYKGEISPPSPVNGNDMYYLFGTDLYRYSLSENKTEKVEGLPALDYTSKKFSWVMQDGRYVLGLVTSFSEYIQYDPVSNQIKPIYPELEPQGVPVQSLEMGEGNEMYIGGYHRGMSIFDTAKGSFTQNLGWMQQPEGMGFLNGKVYFGTYGGAKIFRYDPLKPFEYGETPEHNPGLAYDIEDFQDRPFTFASGDDKLFTGTIPGYGELGGSLTVYNEKTDQWTSVRNVVKDQSIVGLAYKDGLLFGGTSVWGGGGSEPDGVEAKIFVWDAEKGVKIAEFTPDIPGIDTAPKMIGELSFGPDGLLWGAVDGTIFAMEPETYKVVKSKTIYPSTYAASKWRPIFLRWGSDGLLYTTLGRKLTVVDPESLAHSKVMDNIHLMDIGADGDVYYASGSHLLKRSIERTRVTMDEVKGLLEDYRQGGELEQPIYKQVSNSLKQAEHFAAKGQIQKASEFIEKARRQVENGGKHLTEDAQTVLTGSLKRLKMM